LVTSEILAPPITSEVQMHVEELLPVREVASTLKAGRQRVSDADLGGAARSALTSVRSAIRDVWPRHRRASRWPWIAGVILTTTVLGLVLLTPAVRRWTVSRRASGGQNGAIGEATPAMSPPDETSDVADLTEPEALGIATPPVDATE
jgi:hypothetical protein